MKKYWLSIAGVIIAFLILGFSVVRYSRQQYSTTDVKHDVLISTSSAKISDYNLPYPGILPDHPLYFAKMLRDRVRLMVKKDAVEKIDLLLFYADKRIGAADALLKGNKLKLAEVTAHKAELYMGQALEAMKNLEEDEKQEHSYLWWKYYESISAHKNLLEDMLLLIEGDARVSLEKVLRDCDVRRSEIMGELEIEESEMKEEILESEVFEEEEGYL